MVLPDRVEGHPPKVRTGGRDIRRILLIPSHYRSTKAPKLELGATRMAPALHARPKKRRDGRLRTPNDRLLDQVQVPGPRDRLRAAARPQLAVEVVEVSLDGAHADEELSGDPTVGLARGHELEYLVLAPTQAFG
jgi:hypothetical protein